MDHFAKRPFITLAIYLISDDKFLIVNHESETCETISCL